MISPESPRTPESSSIEATIEQLVGNIAQEFERRDAAGLETILFIPVTGVEGCGKTTLLKALNRLLDDRSVPVTTVKMLGGQETTDAIRNLVLAATTAKMSSRATIHLLQAALLETADSLHETVANTHRLVILADRSPYDAAVYQQLAQGGSRDAAQRTVRENVASFSQAGTPVTATLFIDLDPRVGLARKFSQGGEEVNRFEQMDVTYHDRVREGFSTLARVAENRIVVVDGTLSPKEMQLTALQFIQDYVSQFSEATIIGQPNRLDQANTWIDEQPLRAASMLSTLKNLSVENSKAYLEMWRKLAFAIRDTSIDSTSISRIVELFVNAPIVTMMLEDSLTNPELFINELTNLSAHAIKQNFWREINTIIHAVDRELRHRERRGAYAPRSKW